MDDVVESSYLRSWQLITSTAAAWLYVRNAPDLWKSEEVQFWGILIQSDDQPRTNAHCFAEYSADALNVSDCTQHTVVMSRSRGVGVLFVGGS